MIRTVEVSETVSLEEYEAFAHLFAAVQDLRQEASTLFPALRGRKIWMVNSTAKGGGVAEMLPRMVGLLREIGVPTEWAVIHTTEAPFFDLTKRIHNQIHGAGKPGLGAKEREVYEAVSRENADSMRGRIAPDDILIIHDPQPAGMGAMLKKELGNLMIWRCHIGLDRHTPETNDAWEFLRPYINVYDHAIFSAPEYIPPFMTGRASIIHPAIDPITDKNRILSVRAIAGILCNSSLLTPRHPLVYPPFEEQVERLMPDGSFAPTTQANEIGLLLRPIVTQVSRWDRLKGWQPLLEAFAKLKKKADDEPDPIHRRRLDLMRLVMAGPDPASIQDDPEGTQVLDELKRTYAALEPEMQKEVALLSLPMGSIRTNALIVNAIQRCSTIVAQNSIQEGFGLTATEGMWKRVPVLGSYACGLRQQIRDGIDGRLVMDPKNTDEIVEVLDDMLRRRVARNTWGRNAQRRVYAEFLIFAQICKWLREIVNCIQSAK
jgi:trehalose synthase